MSLKELSKAVVDIKKQKSMLHAERSMTPSRERATELDFQIKVLTNQLYDAVHNLNQYIFQETGIHSGDFPDLLRSDGYVLGSKAGIPLPKCLEQDYA